MTDARSRNIVLVRRFLDAVNTWDFDGMAELIEDDFVFEMPFAPPGFDRRIEGKGPFLAFVREVPSLIDEERLHDVTVETYASDPNELVAEYKSDMNVLTTGANYKSTYVSRFTVRNGRLARFAECFDAIALVLAMGGAVEIGPGS